MSDTKTEILDLAENLIRTRGYHAFSYKDISVPLNIKNAAIHYHFPAKEDLGLAILQRTIDSFRNKVEEWKNKSPDERLRSFIGIYEKSQRRNMVCIMGALGPSIDILPEAMKKALSSTSIEIKNWLINVLEKGKASGDFQFPETAREKADLIISSLLSALILNKVMQEDILSSIKNVIIKSTSNINN